MSDAPRRRLPVVGAGSPPPDDERPPWHWSGIGAVLTLASWLPLAWLSTWLSRRLLSSVIPGEGPEALASFLAQASNRDRALVQACLAVPAVAAYAGGSLFGGYLVGRFGGKAGPKEAGVGGLAAGSVVWALTAADGGLVARLWLWPLAAGLGLLGGYLGGRLGQRKRTPG
ncbi:MAG: hypothetical protein MUF34_08990 [Polyangiaceae bacterium]|jgi:tRNA-(ms[2]io[6]A)-hydroxylase|nr:hypothetical protein [Polyangiaceae bacterium]